MDCRQHTNGSRIDREIPNTVLALNFELQLLNRYLRYSTITPPAPNDYVQLLQYLGPVRYSALFTASCFEIMKRLREALQHSHCIGQHYMAACTPLLGINTPVNSYIEGTYLTALVVLLCCTRYALCDDLGVSKAPDPHATCMPPGKHRCSHQPYQHDGYQKSESCLSGGRVCCILAAHSL